MKHLVAALLAVFSLVVTGPDFAQAAKAAKGAGEVVVYNWSEYIPQDVLDDFTKETGIKVVYSTYESNEAMYAKVKLLRGTSYDVVCPSTYYIDMMIKDGLLRQLDHTKLPNIKNIDPKLMNLSHDPGSRFSIPYMWGTMGIMINKKYVAPGSVTKWVDLLKPEFKGKLMLSDDTRDTTGAALKAVGKSANTTSEADIKAAHEFLTALRPSVRVFDITASKQAFVSEEVTVGTSWNGDALVAKEENSDLEYIYPKEGAIIWADSFAITSGSPNTENAYKFINYMLRPETAVRCVEEYMYSTPNLAALKLLDKDMQENRTLIPTDEDLAGSEVLTGVGNAQRIYDIYWERLKSNK